MKCSLNALAAYSGCTKLVLSRTKLVLSRSGCLPGLLPTYLSIYLSSQASAFVLRGAWVAKFFTGKVGRHRRFAKVTHR